MRHGLLLIDKPQGPTSHDIVKRVRDILGIKSVGHAGTLDPLATGLMVLLVDEATKISDLLLNGDKSYEVKVRFGMETDSWDITGKVKKETPVDLDPELIRSEIMKLSGDIDLSVPAFSAVKKAGKRLYKEARKGGEEIETPVRTMHFYDLDIKEIRSGSATVALKCKKGGFIRSWAHTLGERLGTGGVVEELCRTGSAPFSLDKAITLEKLAEVKLDGAHFIPQSKALPHIQGVTIRGKDERLMSHGQIPNELAKRLIYEQKLANSEDRDISIKVLSGESGNLLALLLAQPCRGLKIKRIFKNP